MATTPGNLALLPTSLTSLELEGTTRPDKDYEEDYDWLFECFSVHAVSQLTTFTALQNLKLRDFSLDPTILPCFPQLQHLSLKPAVVLVPSIYGVVRAQGPHYRDGAPALALLAALRQLPQLQSLALDTSLAQQDNGTAAQQAERLAALTASNHLTKLVLHWQPFQLPEEALQHMLPQGKHLPHMKVMVMEPEGAPLMHVEGVERWVECCPGLEKLAFSLGTDATTAVARLNALLPLRTSLTRPASSGALMVGGNFPLGGDAAVAAVAKLTGLQSLGWHCAALTLDGVQQLTELQCLTRLTIPTAGWKPAGDSVKYRFPTVTLMTAKVGPTC